MATQNDTHNHTVPAIPRERWMPLPRHIDETAPFTFPRPHELPWLDISDWRRLHARAHRIWERKRMPMFKAVDGQGRLLYRMTDTGNWSRTMPLSSSVRRAVLERDGACVWCGTTERLEVDHIVRYVDGGGNDPSNLRTLCEPCHRSRGGGA